MNREILESKWQQAKGKIRRKWGKLTDNEIDVIKGDYDSLVGKLQEKYGYQLEDSQREVNELIENLKDRPA